MARPDHVVARARFRDREDAGRQLAAHVAHLAGTPNLVVLALPRGGVVVARCVADALGAPLDVIVARKLGVPGVGEVALGAIAEGSDLISDDGVRRFIGVPRRLVERIAQDQRAELARRVEQYRGHPLASLRGKTIIVVDDGIATGATMRAALRTIATHRPKRVIVAVPVATQYVHELESLVDELVVLVVHDSSFPVSAQYEEFQVVDGQTIRRLLGLGDASAAAPGEPTAAEHPVCEIPLVTDGASLAAELEFPTDGADPHGLVVFAHGGGSSRRSYRNAFLAGWLRMLGWATLRVDLLLPAEQLGDAADGRYRFDIALIASRLVQAVDWAVRDHVAGSSNMILFGASTGAAAALMAAADRPALVRGVISRAGRIDLAAVAYPRLRAPVLLVVGTADSHTLRLNREALRVLRVDTDLKLVVGAGHAFEEVGALGAVGTHVERWLAKRTPSRTSRPVSGGLARRAWHELQRVVAEVSGRARV